MTQAAATTDRVRAMVRKSSVNRLDVGAGNVDIDVEFEAGRKGKFSLKAKEARSQEFTGEGVILSLEG